MNEITSPQLYDSWNGESLKTEQIIDIGSLCSEPASLLYTRAQRGRIVQIIYSATRIHFFIDELDHEMHMPERDDTFGSTAENLGLTKQSLRALIDSNAPAK